MEELHKELTEMLDLFEKEELTYFKLGKWLSSHGREILEVLSI